jgi:hypothetical protein
MANKTVRIIPMGCAHMSVPQVEQFAKLVPGNYKPAHVRTIALGGNAAVNADGKVVHGALFHLCPDTPLSIARELAGETLSGRVAMYELASTPKDLTTVSKVAAVMRDNNIAQEIDNYGEEYGAFSPEADAAEPWVPQMHTEGTSARNFAKLVRHVRNKDAYALAVSTNMTHQASAAIEAALSTDPEMTVGEYIQSDACSRVSKASDLQNERVARRFAVQLGIDDSLAIDNHPVDKTSSDEFASPVQYARPTSMARWGEMRFGGNNAVRVSNGVYDLEACSGTAVPVIRSPMHGMHTVASPVSLRVTGLPLDPSKDKALGSVAWHPHFGEEPARMGDEEMETLKRTLHWKDYDDASAMTVAADISRHCVGSPALSLAHYQKMGHIDAELNEYITMGAVIAV